ncbi:MULTISPECIES: DUF1002 domain-containing protein [Aeribacillus]|jgi:uncharacterized protein YpuA (DUF1002 family)|uniref:DUF1002 domain-containing protein n=1 Tax=Aeribacillus TaxID=1055323 RepID=UPI0007B4F1B9|nr:MULTISPECIES: DUF1002 domain-containing protein [Aeribacillus]REJ24267.1 MAG: DUF1002 domain-containing protein [Bacillaceae bacterium]KZM56904.1 hypothetical protein A3Q35_07655 [Aeribacillus pallidus]MDR9791695.1 DUF1002 domain-containing protein [Aeribacillus pallidus]MED0649564.1 DUF1002 domain-containing protein [Aeribacillus composti]MED0701777.1 DUF1002 domain-containing protein [Aeribacillus composti]
MKKIVLSILLAIGLATPTTSFADSVVGDVIVTLGSDLTEQQKQDLLKEMGVPDNVQTVTVTNEEEHKYLGDYIPKAQIGSKAISSSKIQIEKKGSGLEVQTNNINWVTDEMYLNALMTAGVKDANVYVTAPFEVSGTAALTGLIKAYEVSTDKAIPEDVKQVANQELVETAKLGDKIGDENASALIAKVKEQMSENGVPKNDQELREMIEQAAKDLQINLSEDDINNLILLFNNMINVNINWDEVGNQLDKAKDKISKFLESEEGQSFLQKLKEFFSSIIDAIASFFQ